MIRILDSFASATWLKSKGFDRIFRLASSSPPPKNKNLVFIIFANILTFKKVLDHISFLLTKTTNDDSLKEFHIILVPNLYHSFKSLIESQGLVGHVNLYRLAWDFIKIDQNLLSLEIPSVFADVFVRKDKSILSSIANSLRIFHMIHKRPKIVLTCGENSESIVKMVHRIEKARKSNDEPSDFDAMLVIDRDADYASCLLTPVTYSALLVEVFNVKAGILNLEGKKFKLVLTVT
jgi:Sec1 family